jgi:hypothetical protein
MRRLGLCAVLAVVLGALAWSAAAQQRIPELDPVWWQAILQKQGIVERAESAEAVVIAIDNSGSIRWAKRLEWEKAWARTAIWFLAQMHLEIRGGVLAVKAGGKNPPVVVYSFNSDIALLDLTGQGRAGPIPLLQLVENRGGSIVLKNAVVNAIDGVKDTGNLTWLNGAIDEACPYTRPVKPNGMLILFTDGKPTTPTRNGALNVPAAMRATKAAMTRFLANCSTVILTGIDVEGTEAEDFLAGLGEGYAEDFCYTNISVAAPSPLPRPLNIAFEGLEDPYLGLKPGDGVSFEIRWQPDDVDLQPAEDYMWALLLDTEEGALYFAGAELGLGEFARTIEAGQFDENFRAGVQLTMWEPGVPWERTFYIQAVAWRADGSSGPGSAFVSNILHVEVLEENSDT